MIPALIQRGWKIFPVNKAKQPLVKWREWATNDIKLITAEFTGRNHNVGIACGESGLLVLDDDDDGEVVRLFADHGSVRIANTYRVKTARGWHYYFNGYADIGNRNPLKDLGYKIDVRGNGGFVVAAGSTHENGHVYMAEDPDAPVLDAPSWLLGLLRASPSSKAGEHIDLGVFEEERRFTLDQAKEFVRPHLERLRSAQDGEINDRLNYAAKCLAHFGEEFWSREDAESWLSAELEETVYDGRTWSAYVTVQSAYGSAADDWQAILVPEMAGDRPEDPSRYYLTIGELDRLPEPEPLIDGVLDKRTLFVVAGRGDTFKSFLTFDWLASIATGREWQGHEVKQAKVLLVVGEGAYGLRKRRDAWQVAWDTKIEDEWMHIRRAPINLFRGGGDCVELLERIEREYYEVILFDTLQRMSSGAESNSAKDAGIVIARLGQIRAITDGTVGVVAHEGKTEGYGVRGSSAWEDDADIVWRVHRPDKNGMDITCTLAKRKDGPEGLSHALRASPVSGADSLVLEAATEDPFGKIPKWAGDVLVLLQSPATPSVGLTKGDVIEGCGCPAGSFAVVMKWLINARKVRLDESSRWPLYRAVTLEETNVTLSDDT